MKYFKTFIVVLFSSILMKACSNKETLDLSKVISDDVSNSRLTLAVLDNNCMSAYDNWLSDNSSRIDRTFIRRGIRIHLMKKKKSYYDSEYIYVLREEQLKSFNIDVEAFKESRSKLLIFGAGSLKASASLSRKFNKTIDASHECNLD